MAIYPILPRRLVKEVFSYDINSDPEEASFIDVLEDLSDLADAEDVYGIRAIVSDIEGVINTGLDGVGDLLDLTEDYVDVGLDVSKPATVVVTDAKTLVNNKDLSNEIPILENIGVDLKALEAKINLPVTNRNSLNPKVKYYEVINKFHNIEITDKDLGEINTMLLKREIGGILKEYKIQFYDNIINNNYNTLNESLRNEEFQLFIKLLNKYMLLGMFLVILGCISILSYFETITRLLAKQYRITRNVNRFNISPNGLVVQSNVLNRLEERYLFKKVDSDVDEIISKSAPFPRFKRRYVEWSSSLSSGNKK